MTQERSCERGELLSSLLQIACRKARMQIPQHHIPPKLRSKIGAIRLPAAPYCKLLPLEESAPIQLSNAQYSQCHQLQQRPQNGPKAASRRPIESPELPTRRDGGQRKTKSEVNWPPPVRPPGASTFVDIGEDGACHASLDSVDSTIA